MTALKKNFECYFNSYDEQERVRHWIDREIYSLSNELHELYAAKNECWFDDLTNAYTDIETCKDEYIDYHDIESMDYDDKKEALREWKDHDNGEEIDDVCEYSNYYKDYIDNLKESQEFQEVFQWFIVSPWLAARLIEQGAPMLETDNHYLWGRTSFGQALELDGIFQRIFRALD